MDEMNRDDLLRVFIALETIADALQEQNRELAATRKIDELLTQDPRQIRATLDKLCEKTAVKKPAWATKEK